MKINIRKILSEEINKFILNEANRSSCGNCLPEEVCYGGKWYHFRRNRNIVDTFIFTTFNEIFGGQKCLTHPQLLLTYYWMRTHDGKEPPINQHYDENGWDDEYYSIYEVSQCEQERGYQSLLHKVTVKGRIFNVPNATVVSLWEPAHDHFSIDEIKKVGERLYKNNKVRNKLVIKNHYDYYYFGNESDFEEDLKYNTNEYVNLYFINNSETSGTNNDILNQRKIDEYYYKLDSYFGIFDYTPSNQIEEATKKLYDLCEQCLVNGNCETYKSDEKVWLFEITYDELNKIYESGDYLFSNKNYEIIDFNEAFYLHLDLMEKIDELEKLFPIVFTQEYLKKSQQDPVFDQISDASFYIENKDDTYYKKYFKIFKSKEYEEELPMFIEEFASILNMNEKILKSYFEQARKLYFSHKISKPSDYFKKIINNAR